MDNEVISLDLPARHKYLGVLASWLSAALERLDEAGPETAARPRRDQDGLSERARAAYDISLAAHEICANIIDHAYAGQTGGRIHITLRWTSAQSRIEIEMCDSGRHFDLAQVPPPDLDGGQVHGYGLFLVQQLMDEVLYEAQPEGNRWRLTKRLGKG